MPTWSIPTNCTTWSKWSSTASSEANSNEPENGWSQIVHDQVDHRAVGALNAHHQQGRSRSGHDLTGRMTAGSVQQQRLPQRPQSDYAKHKAYVSKSRSWSCVPDNLRGSPFQAVMGTAFQNASDTDVTLDRSVSRYVSRQFPDVRWIGKRKQLSQTRATNQSNLSKNISTSEPTIQWTQSEMAEIFC